MRLRFAAAGVSALCLALLLGSCARQMQEASPLDSTVSLAPLDPFSLAELSSDGRQVHPPYSYALTLDTGDPVVNSAVQDLGHEPNGPFWDGVAEWIIST